MCDYCENNEDDGLIFSNRELNHDGTAYIGFEIGIEGTKMYVLACLERYGIHPILDDVEFDINYCTMCGRKL